MGLSPSKVGKPLVEGSFIHDTLEDVYRSFDKGAKWSMRTGTEAAERVLAKWVKDNPAARGEQVEEMERLCGITEVLIAGYLRQWRIDKRRQWLALEKEFAIETPFMPAEDKRGQRRTYPIKIRGKVDGLFCTRKEEHWLLETKTKSLWDTGSLLLWLPFDIQTVTYIGALEKERNVKIAGVVYNLIRRPQLRQGKKESTSDFLDRLAADIKQRPDFYYQRIECSLDQEERNRLAQEISYRLSEIRRWVELGCKAVCRNSAVCLHLHGTNRPCDYLPLCSGSVEPTDPRYRFRSTCYEELS